MNKAAIILASAVAAISAFAELNQTDQLVAGTGPQSYVAGEGVEYVRNYAFCDNRSVRSISVPNATSVGSGAFRGCSALETLELPSLADLSRMNGAFSGCIRLTNVYLTSIDFGTGVQASGFPWQAPNIGIVFHFRNGDFDRFGRKLN